MNSMQSRGTGAAACQRTFAFASAILASVFLVAAVRAQTPPSGQQLPSPSAFNYTRTTSYQYNDPQWYETDEFVEPQDPQSCLHTVFVYDPYGNKKTATKQNCTGATGDAVVAVHTTTSNFTNTAGQAGIVNGQYPYQVTNAKSQMESAQFDARFGTPTLHSDANNPPVVTQWKYDAFGRKVLQINPDGTKTAWLYEYCTQGSVVGIACPTAQTGTLVSRVTETPEDINGVQSGPPKRTYQDSLEREARTETLSFDDTHWIVVETAYDVVGRVWQKSEPYLDTSPPGINRSTIVWTTTLYDVLNRTLSISKPDPTATNGVAKTTLSYQDLTTVTTNPLGQMASETHDSQGQVLRVIDNLGSVLVRQFDAFGNLIATIDQYGNTSSSKFDLRGRKWWMNDPDMGAWYYGFDVFDQLVRQQSPKQNAAGKWTSMTFDALGRMTRRVVDEFTSSWSYDTYINLSACSGGIGKLCEASTTQLDDRKYTYDTKGRLTTETLVVTNGPTFSSGTAYDATTGRLVTRSYPSGFRITYMYNAAGYASQVVNTADGSSIWQANQYDARGNVVLQTYGNGVQVNQVFEPQTGRISSILAQQTGGTPGALVSLSTGWDPLNNLKTRSDSNGDGAGAAVSETFSYDGLNRLQSYTVASAAISGLSRAVSIGYNEIGNILTKSDASGVYAYPASGAASKDPHAVTQVGSISYGYDANGNVASASTGARWSSATMASFNMPTTLAGPSSSYQWRYGPDLERMREDKIYSAGTRTTWFLNPDNVGGLFFEQETETDGTVVNRHFINAGGRVVAVFASTGSGSSTITRKDYWHVDHIGSLVAVTDVSGKLTQHYAYDPFGKRRFENGNFDTTNALVIDWTHYVDQTSTGSIVTASAGSSRGFTGHEELDDLGIIHMNGRLYDANIARFMQADPTLQYDRLLQDFNRFSYLMNNPLNAKDPSGFSDCSLQYGCGDSNLSMIASQPDSAGGDNFFTGQYSDLSDPFALVVLVNGDPGNMQGFVVANPSPASASTGNTDGSQTQAANASTQVPTDRISLWNVHYDANNHQWVRDEAERDHVDTKYGVINGMRNTIDRAVELGGHHVTAEFGDAVREFTLAYNPIKSFSTSLWNALMDKLGFSTPVAKSFAGVLADVQARGTVVNWVAHSQGGIIFAEAVRINGGDLSMNQVTFHSGGNNILVTNSIMKDANVTVLGYRNHPFDPVPQIAGSNTLNPIQIIGSVLAFPFVLWGGEHLSPHTEACMACPLQH